MTDHPDKKEGAPTAPAKEAVRQARPYKFRGEGSGLFQRLSWNFGRLLSRIISMLYLRLHVSGQNQLPEKGGALLVANHQSFLDPWLLGIAPKRQVHYMARDTLFKGGFLQWLMELWNVFPVKRGAADLGAIRNAVDRLEKGFMLVIFPEGTRSEDGTIGTIAPGMVLILNRCKSDVPIVPVCIDGAYDAWPRSAKFPRPRPVRIVHGKPIPAAEWRQLSPDELALRVRRELIALQAGMGSRHAEASAQRLEKDLAEAPKKERPARRPRG